MSSELFNELGLVDVSKVTHLNGFTEIASSDSSPIKDEPNDINESGKSDEITDVPNQSDVCRLFKLFTEINLQRISNVEKNESYDMNTKNEEKIKILQLYIEQLEEQNCVLISTLSELEREIHQRVELMKKRLNCSARTTMETVISINDCEKEMTRIVEERLCIESMFSNMAQHFSSIKAENIYLRDQNFNLNHDVQALLHIIHQARSTGHWEMDCVTFCEVTPEQVFGPVQSISNMYLNELKNECHGENINQKIDTKQISAQESSSSQSVCENHCYSHRNHIKKNSEVSFPLKRANSESRCSQTCALKPSESLLQQKCISLPDIGNIYSCADVMRKSHSCKVLDCSKNTFTTDTQKGNIWSKAICKDNSTAQVCKSRDIKSDHKFIVGRAQSEPHLFMFGDDIYVYRPCEHFKKASNIALNDDFQTNLPPCQSIDLKFPSEDSNLKVCDWDYLCKNITRPVPTSSYHKALDSSSSCLSSESEDEQSKDTSQDVNVESPSHETHFSDFSRCKHYKSDNFCCVKHISNQTKNINMVSSSIQTENKAVFNTIGVQADINSVDLKCYDGNENAIFGMDAMQIKKTILALREKALKAENNAEAKSMLIEQLQNHLKSVLHERDLKDQAFSNLEKKLDQSRADCAALRNKISELNSETQQLYNELQDSRMLNDNLSLKINVKEENINEILKEQQILQEQKRALMIQLDAQGDELESTKNELDSTKPQLENYSLQIVEQGQIIKNLQDALVQSKRAFDAAFPKLMTYPSNTSLTSLQNESRSASKSSIVDI